MFPHPVRMSRRGSFPNPPPPSFPRRRESIPGELHSHSLRGSPSRRPCKSGGGSGVAPDSPLRLPRRACPRAVGGGNPSPAGCTAIASEAVRPRWWIWGAPDSPPPSFPRRLGSRGRESIPGGVHSHSLRGSPSRRPANQVVDLGSPRIPHLRRSREEPPPSSRGRESIPGGVHSHSLRGSPSRRPANQVVDLGSPRIPHLRRSREEPPPSRRESIPGGVHSHSLRGSPSRRPANQVVDLGFHPPFDKLRAGSNTGYRLSPV